MVHILVGIIAIVIGLWGIAANWYMFKDMLVAIVPLAVVCFGMVALLAGMRSLKARRGTEEAGRYEDDESTGS
ncbi:MAG: hypothetical protein AMK72_03390 [Planctomycetes bacterium SM23_25]|nr:MAG: hypothetical protein AMK72_03390 [Planctomycetes bacterium SM23_25]